MSSSAVTDCAGRYQICHQDWKTSTNRENRNWSVSAPGASTPILTALSRPTPRRKPSNCWKPMRRENRAKGRVFSQEAETVSVAGRIMAIRKMGKASFFDIRDGSGKIQLFFQTANYNEAEQELFKDLDIGDIIGVGRQPAAHSHRRTHYLGRQLHPAGQVAPAPAGEMARTERHRYQVPPALHRPHCQHRGKRNFQGAQSDYLQRYASSSTSAALSRWKRRYSSRPPAAL